MPTRFSFSIQTLVVIGLAALLPVTVIPAAWLGVEHAKIALSILAVLVGFIAWGASVLTSGMLERPRSWLLLGFILLPLSYLASALVGHPTLESFFGSGLERDTVVAITLWSALGLLAAYAVSRKEALRSIHLVLIAATLVAAVVQLVRIFWWPQFLMGAMGAASATLPGSWHDLVLLLGLSVFLAGGYLSTGTVVGKTRALLIAVIVVGFAVMTMASFRDIWIALAIASLGALVLSLRHRSAETVATPHVDPRTMPHTQHNYQPYSAYQTQPPVQPVPEMAQRSYRIPLLIVTIVAVVGAVFGGFIHERLPQSLRIIQFEVRPSWEGTMTVITSVWSEGKVLFGSGPNTFANDWARYKPLEVNETPFWEVGFAQGVGLIPTSLATVGVVGGVAWLLFLVFLLVLSWRIIVRSGAERPFAAIAVIAVAYVWAINIFYVPGVGVIALSFVLAGALVGLARSLGAAETIVYQLRPRSSAGVMAAAAAVVLFVAVFASSAGAARAALADAILNRSIVDYQASGDLATASTRVSKALTLYASDRAHRAAVELGLLQLQAALYAENVSQEDVTRIQGVLEETIRHGLAAVVDNEGDLQNWLVLARTYEQLAGVQVQGAYENAIGVYERARDAHPTSPVPYFKLAQLAVAKNDLVNAQTLLDESLSRKQSYLPAHFLRARIFASQGNLQSALSSMQAVVQLAPNEPGAWYELGVLLLAGADVQNAEIALRQAVALEPAYANAWFVLARIYFEAGDRTRALDSLERVRSLNPENEAVVEAINQVRNATTTPAVIPSGSATTSATGSN